MRGVRAQEKRSAHASFYYVRQRMEYIDPPFVRCGESFHQEVQKIAAPGRSSSLVPGARFPARKSLPGSSRSLCPEV
jgi:hypothetical protein